MFQWDAEFAASINFDIGEWVIGDPNSGGNLGNQDDVGNGTVPDDSEGAPQDSFQRDLIEPDMPSTSGTATVAWMASAIMSACFIDSSTGEVLGISNSEELDVSLILILYLGFDWGFILSSCRNTPEICHPWEGFHPFSSSGSSCRTQTM
jgi:hypothetical protein